MHHANHWYGHAHVYARYCGLRGQPPRIQGYLQHGWNTLDGFGVVIQPEPGFTRFVWSEACRQRGLSRGRGDYAVIGSPWAYLLAMEPPPDGAARRSGTLWYPFHGWEGQKVLGDHARLIKQIREVDGDDVTVCLYWLEYRNPELRRLYEDAGFRVISHGFRGRNYRRANPGFLAAQLSELLAHRKVASNRLSTAILYGLSVGCEAGVYGDPMELEDPHPVYGGNERLRRLWPELHGEWLDREAGVRVASRELGLPQRVSAEELRMLFGWSRENS